MSLRFLSLLLVCFIFVSLNAGHVFAQKTDEKPAAEQKIAVKEELSKEEIEAGKNRERAKSKAGEVYDLLRDINEGLNDMQSQHFSMIYSGHNVIQAVKVVEKDVKKAVKSCGENNPDLKDKMDARYGQWDKALSPVMKEAEGQIQNMIKVQAYAPAKDINRMLKGLNEVREINDNQIKKIPVTTPEACEYLHNKMDETQGYMLTLLQSTLVAKPQMFEKTVREQEAPAKDTDSK